MFDASVCVITITQHYTECIRMICFLIVARRRRYVECMYIGRRKRAPAWSRQGEERGSIGWNRNSRGQRFWLSGDGLSLSLSYFLVLYIYICVCSLYGGRRRTAGTIKTLVRFHSCLLAQWLRSRVEFIVDDSFPATLPDRSLIYHLLCSPVSYSLFQVLDHL